ncbi:hypothetical protein FQN49_005512 [Arthroderma sp. PD_2]|nr:hypothetical protein FQN49_005512 [Arthroderma sp. PD_2]
MAPHAEESRCGNGEPQPNTQLLSSGRLSKEDTDCIWEWNLDIPTPFNSLVHDLIFQNVQNMREAPALMAQGVGQGAIVPLCFDKSAWATVAMLAVIKTGAAFVLLDAGQPETQLQEIVKQTEATLIVASPPQQELASRLVADVALVSPHIKHESDSLDPAQIQTLEMLPDTTIFVFFTFGSTAAWGLISADLTPFVARMIVPDSVPGLQVLKLGGELSSVADVELWANKTKLVSIYGSSECLVVALNILTPGGDPRTIGRDHGTVTTALCQLVLWANSLSKGPLTQRAIPTTQKELQQFLSGHLSGF